MLPQNQARFTKCNRGVFGLSSWEPLRQPRTWSAEKGQGDAGQGLEGPGQRGTDRGQNGQGDAAAGQGMTQGQGVTPVQSTNISKPTTQPKVLNGANRDSPSPAVKPQKEKRVIAKYTYKSNPDSPIGRELDMKPGDKFTIKSDQNEHWWLAENTEGVRGYVPASYVMVHEVTELPWLAKKDEVKEEAPMETTFGSGSMKARPYVSAYNRDSGKEEGGAAGGGGGAKKWYCEICDKTLNGPQPYSAHMSSRAHKEEVEYQQNA